MSRIGKVPVKIPQGVKANLDFLTLTVQGKLGNLSYTLPDSLSVSINNNQSSVIEVLPISKTQASLSMWGTATTLIRNMVVGVSTGFSKTLTVKGTGYKSVLEGKYLRLSLGYSHDIIFAIPEGINIKCEGSDIVVSGYDKQKVGQICGEIISYRPVEPYKGKGIYIAGSKIRRKEGKKK